DFCIEPLADGSSVFVRHFETVVLIDDFAARVNNNFLCRLFFLQFRIELPDQIALQRIALVVTHDARDQDASKIFRKTPFALENEMVNQDGGPREDSDDKHNANLP